MKVLPERTSLTHTGAVPVLPLTSVELPPAVARYCKRKPLLGVTIVMACRELAARLSRIITPALDQTFAFVCEATRAVIVALPLRL